MKKIGEAYSGNYFFKIKILKPQELSKVRNAAFGIIPYMTIFEFFQNNSKKSFGIIYFDRVWPNCKWGNEF